MLRKSGFLAIALSVAVLLYASGPAAAYPLQVFGGGSNHLSQLPSAAPVSTRPQASREASHVLGTVGGIPPKVPLAGLSKVGNAEQPIPKSHVIDSVQNAQIPQKDLFCAQHPTVSFCHSGSVPQPPQPQPQQPPQPQPPHHQPDGGPVVILAPQVPIQVPVGAPVYSTAARVTAGTGAAAASSAQPVVTPACMTAADIPALAAEIDRLLPTAQLSEADMSKVTELRQMIQMLATDGKVAAARDVEEVAMNVLGYQKVWLRCGLGTFEWEKLAATTPASQAK